MIFNILFFLAGALLHSIVLVLTPLTQAIPSQIQTSISSIFGYLNYFRGWFPVNTLMQVVSVYLGVLVLVYTWRLVLYVFALTPWFGKDIQPPSLSEHIVDLRGQRVGVKVRGIRSMKDIR